MAGISPTQRTLKILRDQGYYPWIVERFNAFSGRRTDYLNIIDILIVVPSGMLGVQSCGTAFSEHKKKILEDETWSTKHWLKGKGNELILIGWRKLKIKRGGKAVRYEPRIAYITMTKKGKLEFREKNGKWFRTRWE